MARDAEQHSLFPHPHVLPARLRLNRSVNGMNGTPRALGNACILYLFLHSNAKFTVFPPLPPLLRLLLLPEPTTFHFFFQIPSCHLNKASPLVTMDAEHDPPRARWSVSMPNASASFLCVLFWSP